MRITKKGNRGKMKRRIAVLNSLTITESEAKQFDDERSSLFLIMMRIR